MELIEEHLLDHPMYADDKQLMAQLTINDIPGVVHNAPELYRNHPGLVPLDKASAESDKIRADLVRIQEESDENRRS